ncbi:MAG: hypothetical protein Q8R04_04115 [Nanoarchaeota archaeon]|nr:hypothetical protein [Nanoarchaeota archaeon]
MKRTKCEECGGKITRKTVSYDYLGEHIGKYEAEVCEKCGEIVFDEGVSEKIEKRVKEMGLYGLGASTKVGVAGSSFVIRITKKLAKFLKLEKGEDVHVYPENKKRLIVEISK